MSASPPVMQRADELPGEHQVSDYARTVAKILQREQPVQEELNGMPEPWSGLAQVGLKALSRREDPCRAVEQEIDRGNGDGDAIRELLYIAALQVLSEPAEALPEAPDWPALPEEAQPDPALGEEAGQWVDLYTEYAMAISPMTPKSFHESAALWLGAVAIARRLRLVMPFGEVYPNLFVFWLAPTTLYRKSTALNVARNLARRVVPHLMAAQDTTPEAFLSDLAGREPFQLDGLRQRDRDEWAKGRDYAAQKGWVLDEMSGLLAGAGRDYNAGLVECLLRFYDCDPHFVRSTRGQGRVVVRNSYLSLMGASTPAAMAQHLTAERLWSMGWWPRFAVLAPDAERPPWQRAREPKEPPQLAGDLTKLYARLPSATWPNSPESRTARLGTGVYEAWETYNKVLSYDLLTDDLDQRLFGSYGRLPALALKAGLILAALDGWPSEQKVPTVELSHLSRAIALCEQWRASAHCVLAMVTKSEFDKTLERVLYQLGRHEPQGATLRDLKKAMKDKQPEDIEDTLRQGMKLGLLEAAEWQNPKGGRKTVRYSLVKG